ncbi:retrovirus-related pol polyprotein from transposon TNT 1-94 [Tanacetum coccineum]
MEPSTKDDDFGEIRPQELKFMLEPKTQISCHVRWFNKSNRYMAFKVKVRVGIVKPYSTCEVQVTRQALVVLPPSNVVVTKNIFLFQRAFVDKDISINDVSSIFRCTEGGKYINETKLKVVLDFTIRRHKRKWETEIQSPRVGQALLQQLVKTSREYTNYLLSAEDRYRGRGYDRGHEAKQKQVKIMEDKRDKRDSDDALICCVENTVEDRILDFGASFHATYCKEELERFKLRSSKVRLADDKTLDIASIEDVVLKISFGTS